MIKFKDITTKDKETIQRFTLWGERQNCDLSFANLISWRFLYNTQFAIIDNYLVFRFYAGHHLAYMAPVSLPVWQPDGTFRVVQCEECSEKVIKAIREDSIAMGHPFLMLGVCKYMRGHIEQAFPDTFDIKENRDYSDYIYLREKLISLSGKHLQSKRNHINKFKSLYPNYEYRELTKELIPECLRLESIWREQENDDLIGKNENEGISEELRSMTRAFNRWEELGLIGGTIFIDDKMVAFTFGNPINQNTFDVCVEKADIDYEGAFTIINQEFVKHLPEKYVYINREEDMGDEGLRRAKMSYHPEMILEKFSIMEKYPLEDFEDQDRIKSETKDLWKLIFNDSDEFINLYFSKIYKPEINVTCQINHHVVGALQRIPYILWYNSSEIPSAYISGVCTHPDFRKQDIGTNLMKQAHRQMYDAGIVFAFLIPAEEWLYGWYNKLGYCTCMTCTPYERDITDMDFGTFDKIQRQKSCVILHDSEGLEIIKEDIKISGNNYVPQKNPIKSQIRVVNALQALKNYARKNTDELSSIRVRGDYDIPMNNAYYSIRNGEVFKSNDPDSNAKVLTIAELSEYIFHDEKAEMSLMLN